MATATTTSTEIDSSFSRKVSYSELILNKDGSIYHLGIHPSDLADIIFLVGDPDRVPLVSQYFDVIEVKKHKREMQTHTGRIGDLRLSVISTVGGSYPQHT
jgi:uridine phosphorylase